MLFHQVTAETRNYKLNAGLLTPNCALTRYGGDLFKNLSGFLRTILMQLVGENTKLLKWFVAHSGFKQRCQKNGEPGTHWVWSEAELTELASTTLLEVAKFGPVRLYVDGLDEIEEAQAERLVDFVRTVSSQAQRPFAVYYSARPFPNIIRKYDYHIVLQDENREDIEVFVHNTLWSEGDLFAPLDRDKIKQDIITRAKGVFQWVALVTERVVRLQRDTQGRETVAYLLKAIQAVPEGLADLYEDLLGQLDRAETELAMRLIPWLLYTNRPLSLEDLRHAVLIDPSQPCRSLAELKRSMHWCADNESFVQRVARLSGGLAKRQNLLDLDFQLGLDFETVGFDHDSVNDYMINRGLHFLHSRLEPRKDSHKSTYNAHDTLARCCIRYRGMRDLMIQSLVVANLNRAHSSFTSIPFSEYSASAWMKHAAAAESDGFTQDALLQLTSYPSSRYWQIWDVLYQFYCKQPTSDLFPRATPMSTKRTTLMHVAARFGLLTLLKAVIDRIKRKKKANLRTSISNEAQLGPLDTQDEYGKTPLFWATEGGHSAAVSVLIEEGASIERPDNKGMQPIHVAARDGRLDILQLLLQEGADPDCVGPHKIRPTHCAAFSGHPDVLQELLRAGAYPNVRDDEGWTPLRSAIDSRNHEAAKLLLNTGKVDVNSTDALGETPLHAACRSASAETVDMLASCKSEGVDFLREDSSGRSALDIAEVLAAKLQAGEECDGLKNLRRILGKGKVSEAVCLEIIDVFGKKMPVFVVLWQDDMKPGMSDGDLERHVRSQLYRQLPSWRFHFAEGSVLAEACGFSDFASSFASQFRARSGY